jgi:NAD(P)-dependent dehydrogenase (short-subunit alcohol dehydrogenase family)
MLCGGGAAGINIPALLVDPAGKARARTHSAHGQQRTEVQARALPMPLTRVFSDAPQEEMSEELFDKIVAVNQKGVFLCTQAVVRHVMRNRASAKQASAAATSAHATHLTLAPSPTAARCAAWWRTSAPAW